MTHCAAYTLLIALAAAASAIKPRPSIAYTVGIDATKLDVVEVAMRLENVPTSFRLAMKVHAEYDAKYWRYLDSLRVEGSANDRGAGVARIDSTLWQVTMPGGRGVLRYRVRVQPQADRLRDAWRPFVRETGALINSPDFFLYLPDFAAAPSTVTIEMPADWQSATSLARVAGARGGSVSFSAPDAATLLDSPILLGKLREWVFADRGTTFHVVYWPLPNAASFDTAFLVDRLQKLTRATLDVFGRAPAREFFFLLQDGAVDALEHRASVTIGLPSEELARDPRARTAAIAHEFFHTWNLVAIHPDRYGDLSFSKAPATTGLWWGEGVTIHYSDVLPRRAGIVDSSPSRLEHLSGLLRSYYAAWWSARVSPERASLAFGASPITNSDATGGYYTQGELLGEEIDALVRDSTHERHGLDDVMRALFARSAGGHGFTAAELEAVTDSVCGCRLHSLFAMQVRGNALIDMRPVLARLGLRLVVDSVQASDPTGAAAPDLRIGFDFTESAPALRLVLGNPASVWRRAGLRTGDELISLNGVPVRTFGEVRPLLRTLRIGDTAAVDVRRDGTPMHVRVPVSGYVSPRVTFVDTESVTAEQRSRRARWLAGW